MATTLRRFFCSFCVAVCLTLAARVCGDNSHHHSDNLNASATPSEHVVATANGHESSSVHHMHMTHAPTSHHIHNHDSIASEPSMQHGHDSDSPEDSTDHNHGGDSMDHDGSMGHDGGSMNHGGHSMDDTVSPGHSNDDSGHHGDTHSSGSGGHSMQMFFELGHSVVILFEDWNISSVGGLIGSCIGLFFAAGLYEGLKWFRERLMSRAIKEAKRRAAVKAKALGTANSNIKMVSSYDCEAESSGSCENASVLLWVPFFDHFIQTLLHMLQVFVSYLLMLAFMTYNVWIGLAITLGAGCGYFVFLACLPEDARVSKTSEHCH